MPTVAGATSGSCRHTAISLASLATILAPRILLHAVRSGGRGRGAPMPTVFTRVIEGELPGRFVWEDERCAAFLSAYPLRIGHTLLVPRAEVDHWLDPEPALLTHLMEAAQSIGRAIQRGFKPAKVGVLIGGLEVPHVHIHLVPVDDVHDLDFDRQDTNPDPALMDQAAETIRAARREVGIRQVATRGRRGEEQMKAPLAQILRYRAWA